MNYLFWTITVLTMFLDYQLKKTAQQLFLVCLISVILLVSCFYFDTLFFIVALCAVAVRISFKTTQVKRSKKCK